MSKVKRDNLKYQNSKKKEPESKLKYVWLVLGWGPWGYGCLVFLAQGVGFWMDFVDRISPRITANIESQASTLFQPEITFKNESSFALQDVQLRTELIYYEPVPYVTVQGIEIGGQYQYLGEIRGHAPVIVTLPLLLQEQLKQPTWTKVAICQELSFHAPPLTWFATVVPIRKRSWSTGFFIDKPEAIRNWKQRSCEAVKKGIQVAQKTRPTSP
jgi:hypothetical protein